MSRSDGELAAAVHALAGRIEAALGDGAAGELDEQAVRRLVSATARVYASAAEETEVRALDPEVSPTEAVVLAAALLRARDLNPFDLAVWFSRSAPPG